MKSKQKQVLEGASNKQLANYLHGKYFYYGDTYECPVCSKAFTLTTGHSYIIGSSYTCSWECFLKEVKSHPIVPAVKGRKGIRQPIPPEAFKATGAKEAEAPAAELLPEEPPVAIVTTTAEEKLEVLW